MSWWDRDLIVYLAPSALLLRPPGRAVFHRQSRLRFPKYVDGVRVGDEQHRTRCGLPTFDSAQPRPIRMDALRRDNAERVGRACRRCYPTKETP